LVVLGVTIALFFRGRIHAELAALMGARAARDTRGGQAPDNAILKGFLSGSFLARYGDVEP
jgi:hypothetical protein